MWETGEGRQAEQGECMNGECGLCALGGVRAVRGGSGGSRAVVEDHYQDREEGGEDGQGRPRPVFREELGESALITMIQYTKKMAIHRLVRDYGKK